MMKAWGVDGCKGGWFYFGVDSKRAEYGVVASLEEFVDRIPKEAQVLVDIPIGLRDGGNRERRCDLEARRVLSPVRSSTVFPAPARAAVYSENYQAAGKANNECLGKGLSKQSWALAPKIRELDRFLQERPEARERIREVHPEVCFWGLTGGPMQHSKKTRLGVQERLSAIAPVRRDVRELVDQAFLEYGGFEAQRDDIIDALVAALCALNIDECRTLPDEPEADSTGLKMEMVYWSPSPS